MSPKDFHLHVAEALSSCQLVEQELKLYIAEALELVRRSINGRMSFKMTGRDYDDASLERLIETFKKLSDDVNLQGELRRFKDERNFIAHKAVVACLDRTEELDNESVAELEPRLLAIAPKARELRLDINDQANEIRVHLWPDLPGAA